MATETRTADPAHTNRLAEESSPYLLQHAHNPVDWYPWGAEAFERARKEGKPIFLSVGYSTCYWCHVMERQSFENESIAAVMNQKFVNIKVDREERPDVDQLYMTAVQVLTHQGGWPMSVFLTPELKPFYGGTYFPPADAYGRPGFPTLLNAIEDAYRSRGEEVQKTANQIVDILRQLAEPPPPSAPVNIDEKLIESLVERSTADFEPNFGGFGHAPKFPRQTLLELLLVHNRYHPKERRLRMLLHTLNKMSHGGIRDHLGGGFHRYSTDAEWLVPHFEIMLYDNAMLAWVYTEVYRQTEDVRYAHVARGILNFVLRELTSGDGAFYTALDAETNAREGETYLWTSEEIDRILGPDDAKLFKRVYGVDRGPNFADPHHGTGSPDRSILYLPNTLTSLAAEMDLEPHELDAKLDPMRAKLYGERLNRKQPLLDTKIITSWNALMIRALAYAGSVLQEKSYIEAAGRAADFLLTKHRTADRGLYRASRNGKAKYAGFLDDYAFLAQALLALNEAGAGERRREQAGEIALLMLDKFGDSRHGGGLFFTDAGADDLIVRQKTASDSPLPSGNAVAAMVLTALGRGEAARDIVAAFAGQLEANAEGMSSMVEAAMHYTRHAGPITVARAAGASADDRPMTPQQVAAGVVTIQPKWTSPLALNVHVQILSGFHINAHEASEGLLATQLSVTGPAAEDVAGIDYPPGTARTFPFSDQPARVYDGEAIIAVRFKKDQLREEPITLSLFYQACDDTSCLPPVTQQIDVTTP